MTAPANKDQLLTEIDRTFSRFELELDALPSVLVHESTIDAHVPGKSINACDLVAHATGWTELALKWFEQLQTGTPLGGPDENHSWDDLDRLASSFYCSTRTPSFQELRQRLLDTKTQLVNKLSESDGTLLFPATSPDSLPVGPLIHRHISSLYEREIIRLRAWKRGLGWV